MFCHHWEAADHSVEAEAWQEVTWGSQHCKAAVAVSLSAMYLQALVAFQVAWVPKGDSSVELAADCQV